MAIGHGSIFRNSTLILQLLTPFEVSEQFPLRLLGLMIFLAVGRCGKKSGQTPEVTQGATLRFVPSFLCCTVRSIHNCVWQWQGPRRCPHLMEMKSTRQNEASSILTSAPGRCHVCVFVFACRDYHMHATQCTIMVHSNA